MYVVMRLVSLVLVVAALMMMGGDVVTSLEKGGDITVRSFDQVWALFGKHSIDASKGWLEHTLPGFLSHGVEAGLALPGWAVTGVPGVILAFIFGRHHGA
jgi:hypothetical protein